MLLAGTVVLLCGPRGALAWLAYHGMRVFASWGSIGLAGLGGLSGLVRRLGQWIDADRGRARSSTRSDRDISDR